MSRAQLLAIFVFFVCYLAMLGLIGMGALASAVPEHPEPVQVHGCAVTLPSVADDRSAPLIVRTTRPLSECDESTPVAFGASIRDNAGGRR